MNPADMDRMETRTPTTHAIPTTTIDDGPRRLGMVCNPKSVTAAICLRAPIMRSVRRLAPPKRIDDVKSFRTKRWNQTAQKRNQHGQTESGQDCDPWHLYDCGPADVVPHDWNPYLRNDEPCQR